MAFALALPGSTEATFLNEVKKLTASDAEAGDFFGLSMAVNGDTAVVGALLEDAGGSEAGAAYVFQRNEGGADNWGEVKKLTASDAQAGDWFGWSVAVSGDTAVVGAPSESRDGSSVGAAYVFQRDQGGADNWGEVKKLSASDAQAGVRFGVSVAVSGDTGVVGAYPADDSAGRPGAAYVFQRNDGGADNWGEVTKLTASDAEGGEQFGTSVAVSGDTAVVGARGGDAAGTNSGAAYVFQRDEGGADNWGEVKKLTASDAAAGDRFGLSVAVSGDTAVVGAFAEEDAGGLISAGAAYVFQRDARGADNWGEVKKLTASDAEAGDGFGVGVAVSGDTAVVGAFAEGAGGSFAGAAYVFDLLLPKPTPTPCSPEGCPTATPTITPTPAPLPGDATCDGRVDSIDAALVLQFNAGLLGSLPCADGADVNGDGEVSSIDAALILQFVAGLLPSLAPS